jgi:hypothetical protein
MVLREHGTRRIFACLAWSDRDSCCQVDVHSSSPRVGIHRVKGRSTHTIGSFDSSRATCETARKWQRERPSVYAKMRPQVGQAMNPEDAMSLDSIEVVAPVIYL